MLLNRFYTEIYRSELLLTLGFLITVVVAKFTVLILFFIKMHLEILVIFTKGYFWKSCGKTYYQSLFSQNYQVYRNEITQYCRIFMSTVLQFPFKKVSEKSSYFTKALKILLFF